MDSEAGRIESWKLIADYIRCDVTTAMRWEKERGLPVHRHPGSKRSGVYTFRHELDAWLKDDRRLVTDNATRPEASPASDLLPVVPRTVPVHDGAPSAMSEGPGPIGVATARRPLMIAGALLIGLLGVLGAVTRGSQRLEDPVAVRVEGATLEALDAFGARVWSRAFAAPFKENSTAGQELANRSWIGDLDGDGRLKVLFLAAQPVVSRQPGSRSGAQQSLMDR